MFPSQGLRENSGKSDIYYSNNEREKYRSVEPPPASYECVNYQSTSNDACADNSTIHRACKDSFAAGQESKTQNHINQVSKPRNVFFELATADDCIDRNVRWPLLDMQPIRDAATYEQLQKTYFNLALPDAPMFLQITHFYVEGRSWTSVEENIIRTLFARQSQGLISEYRKLEFLWICNLAGIVNCTFQIRAYVDASGTNIIVEMQRISGSTSSFSEYYHLLRSELVSTNLSATSSSGSYLQTKANSDLLEDQEVEEKHDEIDSDIEFLLIPVLEMMQSNYPDMQLEALKMTCDLSSNLKETDKCSDKDSPISENIGCIYSGESARSQMREMNYFTVLIDIVCRCHESNGNQGCTNDYYPVIGLRAITALLNLSENQVFSDLLSKSGKSSEFSNLLFQVTGTNISQKVYSEQLQNICRKLLSLL